MKRTAFSTPRRIGLVAGVATMAMVLTACGGGSGGGSSTKVLRISSYGDTYQQAQTKAFFDPFVKAHPGVKIVQDSPTDIAKLRTMVDAGKPQWDVAIVSNDFGNDAQKQWLTPIDYSVVDKSALTPGYAGNYRVGADVEGTVVAYRKDKFSSKPTTWADFFNTKKFPGKRAVNKYAAGGILEAALLADGVAQKDLYPLDVPRALRKLDTIKKDIVWWDTGAQSEQLLQSGEVSMGMVWVARATSSVAKAPVAINWSTWVSQDGYWVVPKGTPNRKLAMEFVKFATSKAPQEEFSKLSVYGPTNAAAAADPAVAKNPDRPSNHIATRATMDDGYYATHLDSITKQFNDWLLR